MVNLRRRTQVVTSDDEEEAPFSAYKGKRTRLLEENNKKKNGQEQEKKEELKMPRAVEDAKPIGKPIRVSGKGKYQMRHYESFEFNGIKYTLEDQVLFQPEKNGLNPYVGIIKDIKQVNNGNVNVMGQWFYRPEDAEKKSGGNWKSSDTRELFYSFHCDEVHAEAVMHKCVVHFVPKHMQLPKRKDHPGFIVQKVYDNKEKKLWMLGDKNYEPSKQQEIDMLISKTLQSICESLEKEPEEALDDGKENLEKKKKRLRKKGVSPLDVSKD